MIDFEDELKGYSAIIYVMENSKSVVVHFGGFEDIFEAIESIVESIRK